MELHLVGAVNRLNVEHPKSKILFRLDWLLFRPAAWLIPDTYISTVSTCKTAVSSPCFLSFFEIDIFLISTILLEDSTP